MWNVFWLCWPNWKDIPLPRNAAQEPVIPVVDIPSASCKIAVFPWFGCCHILQIWCDIFLCLFVIYVLVFTSICRLRLGFPWFLFCGNSHESHCWSVLLSLLLCFTSHGCSSTVTCRQGTWGLMPCAPLTPSPQPSPPCRGSTGSPSPVPSTPTLLSKTINFTMHTDKHSCWRVKCLIPAWFDPNLPPDVCDAIWKRTKQWQELKQLFQHMCSPQTRPSR